jgi:hypothetical protein
MTATINAAIPTQKETYNVHVSSRRVVPVHKPRIMRGWVKRVAWQEDGLREGGKWIRNR